MENLAFFKIIILTLINLLGYLLSIFFIVSLYNIKILSFYFDKEEREFLNKQYKELSISFVFHTFFFLGYIVTIFIMIYRSDLSIEIIDNVQKVENVENVENIRDVEIVDNVYPINTNQYNIDEKYEYNNNQFNIDNRIRNNLSEETENEMRSGEPQIGRNIQNNNANIQSNNNNNNNNQENKEEDKFDKINLLINIIIFFVCQFFYLLHLILISVDSKNFKELFKQDIFNRYKFVKRTYIDILISGYIFFGVFAITTFWVFVFTREQFNCLPNFNIRTWDYLDNYFDKFLKNTPEQLKKSNTKMDREIEQLKNKRDELKIEIYNINQIPNYNYNNV